MIFETKKGKYTDEENEIIIRAINDGLKEGKREREILKELSQQLKRGYAGIMSHVRKLRSEYADRFNSYEDSGENWGRLNSWNEEEEELVIQTVNRFLEEGKSLSSAISELEKNLSRTQGAIYQRIYTLRRKHPERFKHLPAQRPRRRHKFHDWQMQHPMIPSLEEAYPIRSALISEELKTTAENQLASAMDHLHTYNQSSFASNQTDTEGTKPLTAEEEMLLKAFEERYGRPNPEARGKIIGLMRTFGCTRVSIALFTLTEDKSFPSHIVDFLEQRLRNHKFL
jgi:hypothetical protein